MAAELEDQRWACPLRGPLEHRARIIGGKLPDPAVGGEEGVAEFGRLQAQLARHESGIAGRFPAAQVVGLAPHHGVHGRQPRFAGGSGDGRFQFGQHRVDTEGPDSGSDPAGIAGQCGQPRWITVERPRVPVEQVQRGSLRAVAGFRPAAVPPCRRPLLDAACMAGVTDVVVLAAGEQRLVGEGVARRVCRPDLLQGPRRLPVEDPAHLPRPAASQRGQVSGGERAAARRGEQAEHVQSQVVPGPAQQPGDLLVGELAQPGGVRAVRQRVQLVRRERCQRVGRVDIIGQPGVQAAGDQHPGRQAGQPARQPPGDAVPARTQILIQPVDDQQQLPALRPRRAARPAPTAAGTRAHPVRAADPCRAARPAAARPRPGTAPGQHHR